MRKEVTLVGRRHMKAPDWEFWQEEMCPRAKT